MYDWELTLNRMVFDISVRERSELSSQFYVVAKRSSYSRKTKDSHTWLELNSREINVLLYAAACQQCILLDSLGRDFSPFAMVARDFFPSHTLISILGNISSLLPWQR